LFLLSQGIKLLYVTLVVSMPNIISIGIVITLIFFMYAYVGVQVQEAAA
jgi:type III secretory pathway component EscS